MRLSKIGNVKIKLHRAIEGTIKRLNINRQSTGKWFACFTFEHEPEPREYLKPKDGAMIGVDGGLSSFATLSNGEHIEKPRFFRAEENALAKAQRKLGYLAKSIGDAARPQSTRYTESKAAEAGSVVVMVDPTNAMVSCGCVTFINVNTLPAHCRAEFLFILRSS